MIEGFSHVGPVNVESFLVEWNESEGAIKRIYLGLQKNSFAVVQFDLMKNQFLAAADEHLLHTSENSSDDDLRVFSDIFRNVAINLNSTVTCAGVADEALKNVDSKGLEAVKCELNRKVDQKLF
ncbi:hypothetical protein GH714_007502 [Hevea brasiliensis]|uniref:Uncharacterized protein n=1 Tax=Hevea brasiliensis TaxID=3981 RepID=A0A6A6KVL2_HEVBR|nr:hypothetical protein GH714_007502 [Hevea brasiliensis]